MPGAHKMCAPDAPCPGPFWSGLEACFGPKPIYVKIRFSALWAVYDANSWAKVSLGVCSPQHAAKQDSAEQALEALWSGEHFAERLAEPTFHKALQKVRLNTIDRPEG